MSDTTYPATDTGRINTLLAAAAFVFAICSEEDFYKTVENFDVAEQHDHSDANFKFGTFIGDGGTGVLIHNSTGMYLVGQG